MRAFYIYLARSVVPAFGLPVALGVLVALGAAGPARALDFAPPGVLACVTPCDATAAQCLGNGYGAFCQPVYRLCVERCDPSLHFFETFSRVHPEATTRLNPSANVLNRSAVQRSLCAQTCDMTAITCAASNAINTPICKNGRLQCIDRCNEGQDSGVPQLRARPQAPGAAPPPSPARAPLPSGR